MAAKVKPFITPEQYLANERNAEIKSEYLSGQMFAMAGASESHNGFTLKRPDMTLLSISNRYPINYALRTYTTKSRQIDRQD
jgi:hypothetical protein